MQMKKLKAANKSFLITSIFRAGGWRLTRVDKKIPLPTEAGRVSCGP